ncbi:zinc ribbon domain-containing protein, partial [Streptomyces sp. adm13(2018)]|uniref:zinc ribbon domain-containing protein n=1 Tax=Streptomyces sp. adm13(2018) TaxID=2479007 RepID=UPI002905DA90
MRACPACGAANDPADDFCGNCGAYLGWSNEPARPTTRGRTEPDEDAAPPDGSASSGGEDEAGPAPSREAPATAPTGTTRTREPGNGGGA